MEYNITYRKKDKGIQFIISYKDSSGKWKQKSKQGFKDRKEAKAGADKMLDNLKEIQKNNINTDYEKITFKEFSELYIEHIKLYKEQNTILLYEAALKHFKSLNDIEMIKVNTLNIQMCIDKMIESNLKYSTIDIYLTRVKTIFTAAVKEYKIIVCSPADDAYIKISKNLPNKKALTKAEFHKLISNVKNPKYKIMFLLAGTCGLRIGEILGLTWDCVNFKSATLTINKQWKNTGTKKTGFGELKSKNSYRTIPIPQDTLKVLQNFKNNNPTDVNNRVIIYKNVQGLSQLLKKQFLKCGFNISIHELRHTYATTLISNGVDFKTAAKLLGHDIEQTMKTYSHVNSDMMLKATNIIDKIF